MFTILSIVIFVLFVVLALKFPIFQHLLAQLRNGATSLFGRLLERKAVLEQRIREEES